MELIVLVPKVIQNYISQFPESSRNAYKYFNYDHRVVEERVQRADQKPLYQGPYDLTNTDYDSLVTYAKTQINPILAKYSPVVAYEDALNIAIKSFNNGQFDGKINACHFATLVNSMKQAQVVVMAKKKTKTPEPEKDKVVPRRLLKQLGIDPHHVPQKTQLMQRIRKGLPHLISQPGKGIVIKKSADGGAPNEYLTDFLSLVSQLPTKDFDVIRKLVGRWKQSKILVKEFIQGAVRDVGIDPDYAQKVAEDFKTASVVMDKLERLYDEFDDFDMDSIKTHLEPLQDLIQKVQSKSGEQSPESVAQPEKISTPEEENKTE